MRFIIILAVAIGFTITAPVNSFAEKQNVFEHYQNLARSGIEGFPRFRMLRKNGKLIAKDWDGQLDTIIPVRLNTKNGYLRFEDEGTGGGSHLVEVVVWNKADGRALIGVASTGYDIGHPDNTKVNFYTRSSRGYIDVTRTVWPKPEILNFMRAKMTIKDLRTLKKIGTTIFISLPNHGQHAFAYLAVRTKIAKRACETGKKTTRFSVKKFQRYCRKIEGKLRTGITMQWNKKIGIFEKLKAQKITPINWSAYGTKLR